MKNQLVAKLLKSGSISLLSQIIAFLLIPIVTRLYGPDIFGEYSLILSYLLLLTMLSTLNIQQDITKGGVSSYVYKLNAMLFVFIFFLILFAFLFAISFSYLNLTIYYTYLFCGVVVVSVYQVLYFSLIRNKDYNGIAVSMAVMVISLPLMQVCFYYIIETKLFSLLLSHFLSVVLAIVYMSFILRVKSSFVSSITSSFSRKARFIIRLNFKKYTQITFGRFTQLLNLQLPIILSPLVMDIKNVAVVALSIKFVEITSRFLRSTIGNMVLGEGATGNKSLNFNMMKVLKLFSFFSSILLFSYVAFSIYLADFIFGEEWSGIGYSMLLLAPYFFANVVVAVFYYVMNSLSLNKEMLLLELMLLFVMLFSFCLGFLMGFSLSQYLVSISVCYLIYSLLMCVIIFRKCINV